jgi:ABC-type polar amino acid transport system, ATPase component
MLIGKNIIKKYHGSEILKGVDIMIEPGKITSLVGPSGAGKTTLLRALSLLEQPDSGEIIIDNDKYTFPLKNGETITSVWPKISIVFQQLFLWPHLTIRENILLPLKVKNINRDTELKKFIELFSMSDFIDSYPNQASIGQRQRAAIVRAIMLHPTYLLLDEITSSLDVEQINIILSHLNVIKESGVGIFIVTHLINFAEQASDRVIFLDEGSVLETGGKEVLNNPKHPRIQKFLSIIKAAS